MKMDWNYIYIIATNFGMLLAGVYICYYVFKQQVEKFLHDKVNYSISNKIPKQSNIDLDILTRMKQVRELLNADRVHVYEFHNGEHYANGRSALKMSCTYEVYRTGIEPIQSKLLGVPISVVPLHVAKVINRQQFDIKDIEQIKERMPSTYTLKSNFGIEAFSDLVIKNKKNEPVGFIEVQWCDKSKHIINDMELYRLSAYIETKILK